MKGLGEVFDDEAAVYILIIIGCFAWAYFF